MQGSTTIQQTQQTLGGHRYINVLNSCHFLRQIHTILLWRKAVKWDLRTEMNHGMIWRSKQSSTRVGDYSWFMIIHDSWLFMIHDYSWFMIIHGSCCTFIKCNQQVSFHTNKRHNSILIKPEVEMGVERSNLWPQNRLIFHCFQNCCLFRIT